MANYSNREGKIMNETFVHKLIKRSLSKPKIFIQTS